MKRTVSIVGAFILGLVVASSAGTVSAKVQSMIGQKVTGEINVVVNGKVLVDKGAVINGRTNAPVRAIAEAIGGDVSVSGKTVTINTETATQEKIVTIDGKYYTKYELLNKKTTLEENLKHVKSNGENDKAEYERLMAEGKLEGPAIWEARLKSTEETIAKINGELEKVNEALKQFD